jgi:tRNA (cytidine/uridine-2'-O-)-methyltransferase
MRRQRRMYDGGSARPDAAEGQLAMGKDRGEGPGADDRRRGAAVGFRLNGFPISAAPEAAMSIHVVLVHPEIHWNTGNAGRTCLAVGATLHLVKPLGFSLDDREVKRAGLDYWEHVDVRVWDSWDAFEQVLPDLGEAYFFSTSASRVIWDVPLGAPEAVVLIFGRETGGLPPAIHEEYSDRMVAMPIASPHVRSLNLSTSVGIALYEVLRQRRG